MITSRKQVSEHRGARRYIEAFIPPLNDSCKFRSMSAGEQFAIADQAAKMKSDVRIIAIANTWCDDEGRLLYAWDNPDDIKELSETDGKVIDTLYDVVNTHCANMEPVDKLIKAAEKNYDADRGECLPTA